MKTGKLLLTGALSAVVLFTACKKDDPVTPELTTLQKLQAKWNYERMTDHIFIGGMSLRDTVVADPGDYADFRTDGKVYSRMDNMFDTIPYSLLGTNKLILGQNI